jgi:signal transduction histidine kinase
MSAPAGRRTAGALLPAAFVLAGAVEAVWRGWGRPLWLLGGLLGSALLAVLWLRRSHPLAAMTSYAAASVLATVVQSVLPDPTSRLTNAFVPIIALLVLSYSLTAYGDRRAMLLGAPQPVLVVLVVDVLQPDAGSIGSALPFIALIVVAAPMAAGWLVRSRARLLDDLHETEEALADEHRTRMRAARAETALAVWQRLAHDLGDGLGEIGRMSGGPAATEQAERIEATARGLLARTRHTVVELAAPEPATRPTDEPPVPDEPPPRLGDGPMTWSALLASAAGLTTVLQTDERWSSAVAGLVVAGVLVAALALAWRWPLPGIVLCWGAAVTYDREVARLTVDQVLTAPLLLVGTPFLAGWLLRRRAAVAGLVVCVAGGLVCTRVDDPAGVVVLTGAGWIAGRLLRSRGVLLERLRVAHLQLQPQRAEELRAVELEERSALARDVHDDVGHSLTVLALQAGAARRLAGTDPNASAAALAVVADVARQALARLDAGDDVPADLAGLVDQARRLGVALTVEGPLGTDDLAPQLADTAHRVVQESLTNAMRHAPGAAVTIRVRRTDDVLDLQVANTPTQLPADLAGAGTGLRGMGDRVAAVGGTVRSGPTDDGGFLVHVRLPLARERELVR